MSFSIQFVNDPRPTSEFCDGPAEWGIITIEDFREGVILPTGYWTPARYREQWLSAAKRILEGQDATAFLVGVTGSWKSMKFCFSWVVYSIGDSLVVQNIMLQPRRFGRRADLLSPWSAILPHTSIATERENRGLKISEWTTQRSSIEQFAKGLSEAVP